MVVAAERLIRKGGPKASVMTGPDGATTQIDREDRLDLDQIFRAHQKEIYVYFLRTTGNPHRAEDLGQETFARACSAALVFRGDASVRTWLFSIARRVMVDDIRRRGPATVPFEIESAAPAGDPGERLAIEQALRALPISAREAIVLCDVLGLEPSEAAEITSINANAFRVRLHRARAQFREVYGDDR